MLDLDWSYKMKITADASEAKAELRDVETGIKRVESASRPTAQAVQKVTSAISGQNSELSKSEQALAKAEAAVAAMEKSTAKFTGTSTGATSALSGLRAESAALSTGFGELAGAGLGSVAMFTAVSGGAVIVAGAIGAVVAVLVQSARHYIETSQNMAGLRDEIDHLGKSWENLQFILGAAVVGPNASGPISLLRSLEEAAMRFGLRLATDIDLARRLAGDTLDFGTGGGTVTPAGEPLPTPASIARMRDPNFSSQTAFMYGATHGMQMPPSAEEASRIMDQQDAELERQRKERERERKRAADEQKRLMAQIHELLEHGVPYSIGMPGTMPGESLNLSKIGLRYGGVPDFDIHTGLSSMPGFETKVAIPGHSNGFFEGAFKGKQGFGQFMGNSIMRAVEGGGDVTSSLFGGVGSGITSHLAKLLTGGAGTALTGLSGGLLNAVLPGAGALLGPLMSGIFGKLFGETQGHKDLMAGNKQIADMKKSLDDIYGSASNAKDAAKLLGIDLAAAWGDQNLQGAEHFKGVLDDLAKKQSEFNGKLGDTLSGIQEWGGSVDPSLMPYLDRLRDAKVLTQDNIDLIKKLSADGQVDFDKMKEAAARYGISQDALGQAFNADKIHKGWQQVIDDYDLLIRGGADVTAVQNGMKDKVQELILQSIKFGVDIPANMKPVIQALIDQGKLLDVNGQKITNINQLHFGDTMQTTLEKLNDTLKQLIDALGVKLPDAVKKIPRTVDIDVTYHEHGGHSGGHDPNAHGGGYFAGGTVMHRGGVVQRLHSGGLASDEVPIIAQTGEFMMRRSAVQRLGVNTLRRLNNGGDSDGGSPVIVNVQFTDTVFADDYSSLNRFSDKVAQAIAHGFTSRGNQLPA